MTDPIDATRDHHAVYALYPVYRTTPALREAFRDPDDLDAGAREVEDLLKRWEGRVDVRGAYSTVGFRADADVLLWLVGSSPDDLQRSLVELRRTRVGALMDPMWTFMGVVKPAEFTSDHAPAFVKGEPPKRFACVYPFVRAPEWYLLPPTERGAMLAEHGVMGREFPDVLANTTSAFGLGDWEWILCFEADEADRLVDCIRRLRDAGARRFTKEEVPFVTGIRKSVRDVLDDLV
jgi:hydrogen peroxide-dependent heme synthase